MPESSNNTTENTFATEVEQYAFDQSLANEENVGMAVAVFANILILAIACAVITFRYFRKKSRKKDEGDMDGTTIKASARQ